MDWAKTAFTFPGQGSQAVGMGADFADAYPLARQIFEEANDILGINLAALCFNGPEEALNDTYNTQPALFVSSMAILRVLQNEIPDAVPGCVTGHSMGELSALAAAGSLEFADGVRLARERGRVMKEAGDTNPGAMAALLGLERDDVIAVCEQASQEVGAPVILANDNCPGQIVISGDVAALERAMELASESGAKKVVRLAVSIAAHSPLMRSASVEFQKALDATDFKQPQVPVYSNATAAPIESVDQLRAVIGGQLTSPVRWTESMQAMIDAGIEHFVEIGSGEVLSGLLKRLDRKMPRTSLNSVSSLNSLLE